MTTRARTIAISRQRGSGGSYIGRAVAERLGYRYVDREMLRHAAEYLAANDTESLEAAGASWLDRLSGAIALGTVDFGYLPPPSDVLYEGELFEIEQRLIPEIAERERAVIVGRGAAQLLAGCEEVLTVFVHAPEAWRIARVQQIYSVQDRVARQMVRDSDRDRARFTRALADMEWQDVRGYDLAVNTSALGIDAAVEIVMRAADAMIA
jgi:cytidylate kinase